MIFSKTFDRNGVVMGDRRLARTPEACKPLAWLKATRGQGCMDRAFLEPEPRGAISGVDLEFFAENSRRPPFEK